MARKKKLTGTMTVTFKLKQTDGDVPRSLDEVETWVYDELDGMSACFIDPNDEDMEDDAEVTLEVVKVEITTD
jgi:hypothetical protein